MTAAFIVVALVALGAVAFMVVRGKSEEVVIDTASLPPGEKLNWLVGTAGAVSGKRFYVGNRKITIGRAPTNQIQVPDDDTSRVHCQVTPSQGEVKVTDMQSSSGVFVNDAAVKEGTVGPNDVLRIGTCSFKFVEKLDDAADDALGRKGAGKDAFKSTVDGLAAIDESVINALQEADGDIEKAAAKLGLTPQALKDILGGKARPTAPPLG